MEYYLRLSNGKKRKITKQHYRKILCRAWARNSKKLFVKSQENLGDKNG